MSSDAATDQDRSATHLPLPVGRHVDVAGRRLFVHLQRSGEPVVVFLPGAGAMGMDFCLLQERVAAHATALVYDRAGTGWSDDVPLPRSLGAVTDELRALLHQLALTAPVILVGHSLGGAIARHYAQRFPSDVRALLLIDPAHEDGPAHYPPEVRAMSDAADAAPLPELPLALLALWRDALTEKLARVPPHIRGPLIAQHLVRARTGLEEGRHVEQHVYAELRAAPPTPDVPLIVLTAMGTEEGATQFLPVALQRTLNAGKQVVHRALAASVPRGEERSLGHAFHTWVCLEQEDDVVRAVKELLALG